MSTTAIVLAIRAISYAYHHTRIDIPFPNTLLELGQPDDIVIDQRVAVLIAAAVSDLAYSDVPQEQLLDARYRYLKEQGLLDSVWKIGQNEVAGAKNQMLIGWSPRFKCAIIGFRGTHSREDAIADLQILPTGSPADVEHLLHKGIAQRTKEIPIELFFNLLGKGPVILTGHSLGGGIATIAGLSLLSLVHDREPFNAWDIYRPTRPSLSIITFGAPTTVFEAAAADRITTIPQHHRRLFHNIFDPRDPVPMALNLGKRFLTRLHRLAEAAAVTGVMIGTDSHSLTADGLFELAAYWLNNDKLGAHVGNVYFRTVPGPTGDVSYVRGNTIERITSFMRNVEKMTQLDLVTLRNGHSMTHYLNSWKAVTDIALLTRPGPVGSLSEFMRRFVPADLTALGVLLYDFGEKVSVTVIFSAVVPPYTFISAAIEPMEGVVVSELIAREDVRTIRINEGAQAEHGTAIHCHMNVSLGRYGVLAPERVILKDIFGETHSFEVTRPVYYGNQYLRLGSSNRFLTHLMLRTLAIRSHLKLGPNDPGYEINKRRYATLVKQINSWEVRVDVYLSNLASILVHSYEGFPKELRGPGDSFAHRLDDIGGPFTLVDNTAVRLALLTPLDINGMISGKSVKAAIAHHKSKQSIWRIEGSKLDFGELVDQYAHAVDALSDPSTPRTPDPFHLIFCRIIALHAIITSQGVFPRRCDLFTPKHPKASHAPLERHDEDIGELFETLGLSDSFSPPEESQEECRHIMREVTLSLAGLEEFDVTNQSEYIPGSLDPWMFYSSAMGYYRRHGFNSLFAVIDPGTAARTVNWGNILRPYPEEVSPGGQHENEAELRRQVVNDYLLTHEPQLLTIPQSAYLTGTGPARSAANAIMLTIAASVVLLPFADVGELVSDSVATPGSDRWRKRQMLQTAADLLGVMPQHRSFIILLHWYDEFLLSNPQMSADEHQRGIQEAQRAVASKLQALLKLGESDRLVQNVRQQDGERIIFRKRTRRLIDLVRVSSFLPVRPDGIIGPGGSGGPPTPHLEKLIADEWVWGVDRMRQWFVDHHD